MLLFLLTVVIIYDLIIITILQVLAPYTVTVGIRALTNIFCEYTNQSISTRNHIGP